MDQKFYGQRDWQSGMHKDPIYGLWNPRSRASVLVLWLYSVEPPLYFHLNDACRSMDHPLIPMLGPFARAIYETLRYAEWLRDDKLEQGDEIDDHPLGTFSRSFVTMRGACLGRKAIQKYTEVVQKRCYNDK